MIVNQVITFYCSQIYAIIAETQKIRRQWWHPVSESLDKEAVGSD